MPMKGSLSPASSISSVSTLGSRNESSVRVALRVRPFLPKEIAARAKSCLDTDTGMQTVQLRGGSSKRFTFDHVFPSSTSQSELYETALEPWLDSFLQGFNVTVIAYGQTGSGKTFTVGSNNLSSFSPPSTSIPSPTLYQLSSTDTSDLSANAHKDEGLIPRFLRQLFARLDQSQVDESSSVVSVSVSFLEIYGEEIFDLLDDSRTVGNGNAHLDRLQLREGKTGVYVLGLSEVNVSSQEEALDKMREGCMRRITAATRMNQHSSRSHAVYTVKIVQQTSIGDNNMQSRVESKLTFVDLAGSERLKKTGAEGDRMKEGIQINVGLLALGNVINALGDERKKAGHIPYRSSKLTRLLQDALGGNSRTLFVACVSPTEEQVAETLNTLQYANRAKRIQNKAVKNIDERSMELMHLQRAKEVVEREYLKARFLSRMPPADVDAKVEELMASDVVTSFLRALEEDASEGGNEWKLASFVSQIQSLVPADNYGPPVSNDSVCPIMSNTSDIGSMISTTEEEEKFTMAELHQVARVMDKVLDVEETRTRFVERKSVMEKTLRDLQVRRRRKDQLLSAFVRAVEKMERLIESSPADSLQVKNLRVQTERGHERLSQLESEVDQLNTEVERMEVELEDLVDKCREELERKETELQHVRQIPVSEGDGNVLDLMMWTQEMQSKGDGRLLEISQKLDEREKKAAAYLYEEVGAVARLPCSLIPTPGNRQSEHVMSQLRQLLQTALDEEDLDATIQKQLRERCRLLLEWSSSSYSSETEEKLQTCDDTIQSIRELLSHSDMNSTQLQALLSSLDSETLKGVAQGLVLEVYSQMRLNYASVDDSESSGGSTDVVGPEMEVASDKTDTEELQTLDMVNAYVSVRSSQEAEVDERVSYWSHRSQQLEGEMLSLKEEKCGVESRLEQALEDNQSLREKLGGLEKREDALSLLKRCQEVWEEVGVTEADQQQKFQDINAVLVQKCSEELEGLQVAREQLQRRLQEGLTIVSRLEAALEVEDVFEVGQAPLLELEKQARRKQSELEEEVWKRLHRRVRSQKNAAALMMTMEITQAADFRSSAPNDLDLTLLEDEAVVKWEEKLQNGDASSVLVDLTDAMASEFRKLIGSSCLDQVERMRKCLLDEKAYRLRILDDLLFDVREKMRSLGLRQSDMTSLMIKLFPDETKVKEWVLGVVEKSSSVDVTSATLDAFSHVVDSLEHIISGRKEAKKVVSEMLNKASGAEMDVDKYACPLMVENEAVDAKEMKRCKEQVESIASGVESGARMLLYSLSEDFAAFGMDTLPQRMSFLLGREEYDEDSTKRKVLNKYMHVIQSDVDAPITDAVVSCPSLLSAFDPLQNDIGSYLSKEYLELQVQKLEQGAMDMQVLEEIRQNAQTRLQSLQQIMRLFHEASAYKSKIEEFQSQTKSKDRLFGSSLRLLEEEKFRKAAAKKYPALIRQLKQEVAKWVQDDEEEFDLRVLGSDLQQLLEDMMNANTGLMHLDLGVVDTKSRKGGTREPQMVRQGHSDTDRLTSRQSRSNTPRAKP